MWLCSDLFWLFYHFLHWHTNNPWYKQYKLYCGYTFINLFSYKSSVIFAFLHLATWKYYNTVKDTQVFFSFPFETVKMTILFSFQAQWVPVCLKKWIVKLWGFICCLKTWHSQSMPFLGSLPWIKVPTFCPSFYFTRENMQFVQETSYATLWVFFNWFVCLIMYSILHVAIFSSASLAVLHNC